jgi:glycosyltransferase involved in cell wall biosynthesis
VVARKTKSNLSAPRATLLRAGTKPRPVISVVIPTRDRPETLKSCLAALKHHVSNRIEIVVHDNCSAPETRDVVMAAQKLDPRIRYFRAPFSTSQRHNFELGLAAATGDYMTIIGDDDGFCLGSLDWLAKHLVKEPADAVRWHLVHYAWPSLSTDGEGFVRIYASHYYGGWRKGSADLIAQNTIAAKNIGSWDNILIYHGMISRKIYEHIKAKSGGVFFPYLMPDVYMHNLLAFYCKNLLQVDNPVSIYGTSGHSAGASWSKVVEDKSKGSATGQKWIKEADSDPLSTNADWQPNIRTIRYHDLRGLETAKLHGLLPEGTIIDRKVWAESIIDEIGKQLWTLPPWLTAKPKSAEDKELFRQVKQHFKSAAKKIPSAPDSKYSPTYPDTLLRVRRFDSKLNDDIEGAMLALHALMLDGGNIYSIAAKPHPIKSAWLSGPSVLLERLLQYIPNGILKIASDESARRGELKQRLSKMAHLVAD